MNNILEAGDSVKSMSQPFLNGGLAMNVWKVKDGIAVCDYFEGPESIHKQIELPFSDLNVIHKSEGGFRDAGERP